MNPSSLLPLILLAAAWPVSAADAPAPAKPPQQAAPSAAMANISGSVSDRLDAAGKELSALEALIAEPEEAAKKEDVESLVSQCMSGFSATAMAEDVKSWFKGKMKDRVILGSKNFHEANVRLPQEAQRYLLNYSNCSSAANGRAQCELVTLAFPVSPGANCSSDCSNTKGQACADFNCGVMTACESFGRVQSLDDRFFASMARRDGDAAGRCAEWYRAVRTAQGGTPPSTGGRSDAFGAPPFELAEPVAASCQSLVAGREDAVKICGQTRFDLGQVQPDFMAVVGEDCPAYWKRFWGQDCPTGKEDPMRPVCERHKLVASGKGVSPALAAQVCRPQYDEMRAWYCGRYKWPEFKQITADAISDATLKQSSSRAGREGIVLTRLKAINELMASVTNISQFKPLTSAESEKRAHLIERMKQLRAKLKISTPEKRLPGPGEKPAEAQKPKQAPPPK